MSPVQVNFPTGVFYDPGESFDFQFVLTGGDELGMLLVYRAQYVLSLKREWGLRKLHVGYPATGYTVIRFIRMLYCTQKCFAFNN